MLEEVRVCLLLLADSSNFIRVVNHGPRVKEPSSSLLIIHNFWDWIVANFLRSICSLVVIMHHLPFGIQVPTIWEKLTMSTFKLVNTPVCCRNKVWFK